MRKIWLTLLQFTPVLATVATLAPIAAAAHTGAGIVVLGAAVALLSARGRHGWERLALLPAGTAAVGVFALLYALAKPAGDACFVVIVGLGTAARAWGPRAGMMGRAVMLPLIGMLIAPVAPGRHPLQTFAWATLAVLVATVYGLAAQLLAPGTPEPAAPQSPPRIHVWRGVQAAVAMTVAFTVGQTVFGEHWPWIVISAYVVGAAARSRGDALLLGVHRTLGALGGTLVATPLAVVVTGHPEVAVVLLLAVLGVGMYLRQYAYAWWPAAMTGALVLLYTTLGLSGGEATDLLLARLAGVVTGAVCAILPAALLRPVRTGALLRRRTADALRACRTALTSRAEADAAAAVHAVGQLRDAAKPLLAVRRIHRRAELGWVDALHAVVPDLRLLPHDPPPASLERLRDTLTTVSGTLRAATSRTATSRTATARGPRRSRAGVAAYLPRCRSCRRAHTVDTERPVEPQPSPPLPTRAHGGHPDRHDDPRHRRRLRGRGTGHREGDGTVAASARR